ncbi:MAG TPA: ribonuclease HII [Candidatus Saccharimonadales bacterium]|nr:ribonuclease HII [Candidatus Saccharimonadales bacterium]
MKVMIVGIDEVGRGAWAGPLVVGAVLLGGVPIEGLTDSKKLTKKQRVLLDQEIRKKAKGIGLGWVSSKQIDQMGLAKALRIGAERALAHLRQHMYEEIIIDGTIKLVDDPRVTLMKKADLLVPCVSAASIVAKVARDNYMAHIGTIFPGYGFGSHVGYGTAAHREAIATKGSLPIHRHSFAPLKKEGGFELQTTKQVGDMAEQLVAAHLETKGHEIVARNWRTKYCEIDIISRQGQTLYFTEVKYRKTDDQGGGFAAITPKKLQQMAFAAEFYIAKNVSGGHELRLAAANVGGRPPKLLSYLELV